MSQNPDEAREPEERSSQAQDKEFDSGLDYGAFSSDEPDFPEDRLEEEPAPEDQTPTQDQSPTADSPTTDDAQPTAVVPPVADNTSVIPPAADDEQPRSLSEELAAARSSTPDDRPEAVERDTATGSAADDQPTTVVPAAADTDAGADSRQEYAAPAEPAGQQAPAVPALARHAGSNDDITEADINEEVTKSKRGVSRFFTVLIAIFTPVLFLVAAIRLVGTPVFLWATYQRPGFPDDPHGFGLEERMLYGSYGMDFLFNLANYRYLGDLVGPDGEALFTSSGTDLNEVSHMVDVKWVVWLAMLVGLGLLLLTALFALMLRSWRPGGFARAVFAGAWAAIAVLVGLAVLAILDWQMFFAEFHNLFFDGNWAFPDDYTLIRLYPNQFWIDAGIWVAALLLVFSVVALLITWPTKRRRERRADRLAEVHDRRRQKLIKELNSTSAVS